MKYDVCLGSDAATIARSHNVWVFLQSQLGKCGCTTALWQHLIYGIGQLLENLEVFNPLFDEWPTVKVVDMKHIMVGSSLDFSGGSGM